MTTKPSVSGGLLGPKLPRCPVCGKDWPVDSIQRDCENIHPELRPEGGDPT